MKLLMMIARVFFTLKWLWMVARSSWTAMNTATAGGPISASDYNTYVRDNITYLFSQRPLSSSLIDRGATVTTSSATFVDLSGFSKTKTINSTRAMVTFTMVCLGDGTAGGYRGCFDVTVDGTRIGTGFADGLAGGLINNTANLLAQGSTISWTGFIEGLSVGSHTFKVQGKTNTGTLIVASGDGTGGRDFGSTFNILEV